MIEIGAGCTRVEATQRQRQSYEYFRSADTRRAEKSTQYSYSCLMHNAKLLQQTENNNSGGPQEGRESGTLNTIQFFSHVRPLRQSMAQLGDKLLELLNRAGASQSPSAPECPVASNESYALQKQHTRFFHLIHTTYSYFTLPANIFIMLHRSVNTVHKAGFRFNS